VMTALLWTLATSLTGVILLFGYAFRRLGAIAYIGLPLLAVISWTVGLGWIILGQLNLVSCAFAAVLVGMGVDYAIHIYNRYVEERHRGLAVDEAFRVSLIHTGWGVFIGMVTTAISFLGLMLTRFSQLSEFGTLASIGIFLSVPAMFFILPALIAWRSQISPEQPHMLRPFGFGLEAVAKFAARRRLTIATLGILLAVGAVLDICLRPDEVRFSEAMDNLRPHERAFELNAEIARAFSNRNPNKLMVISRGETWEEALENAARVESGCRQMLSQTDAAGRPLLPDYESIMRFLPPPSRQRQRLAFLRENIDFAAALAAFRAALAEEELAEEDFAFSIAFLQGHAELVKSEKTITPAEFTGTPLEKLLRRLATPRRRLYDLRHEMPSATA
ncbi:MAG: MMPL family transporter, partial [Planctomycetota bacterium]|nr:MMPL family transporter [Planctomycetota bacterium]